MLVVASMVGTGVFTTTGLLVRDIPSTAAVLVAWAVGGVAALCGALAYGELVAALPSNGGEYQLLSRIYHPALGFAAGIVSLVVGFSAPAAASALAFGQYMSRAVPGVPPLAAAIAVIVVMSLVHALRVRIGGGVQNVLTAGKIGLIGLFIVGGLATADMERLCTGAPIGDAVLSPAFAVALIYVSFAYSGWNAAAYVAGEIRRPARSLPIALVTGTLVVTALYLGLNAVFLTAAPAEALSGEIEVGHVAAAHLFGRGAGRALSALIAIALVSSVGALIMTGPRIYEAMGADYPALAVLARRREERGPTAAIVLQSTLALIMVVTTTFDWLLSYIGLTLSLFAALTVTGVFVSRRREPSLARPYRTWGHPITTLLFIALMAWMILHTAIQRPVALAVGAATVAAGVLLYAALRPQRAG